MSLFNRVLQLANSTLTLPFPLSDKGFLEHECPEDDCHKHFAIMPETGLNNENIHCYCPYCGYADDHSSFCTMHQREYFSSVIQQKLHNALFGDLQAMSAKINSRQKRSSPIQITTKITHSGRPMIHSYEERILEFKSHCSECDLSYMVNGVFGFCPYCGEHK